MSLRKYLGYSENVEFYLTPYSFYQKDSLVGCQKSKIVKIKCNKGYTPFDAATYDEIANTL